MVHISVEDAVCAVHMHAGLALSVEISNVVPAEMPVVALLWWRWKGGREEQE